MTLTIKVIQGKDLQTKDLFSKADPYLAIKHGTFSNQTRRMRDNPNPKWNEVFTFNYVRGQKVMCELWDDNEGSKDDLIGTCEIDVGQYYGLTQSTWCTLRKSNYSFKNAPAVGEVELEISLYEGTAGPSQQLVSENPQIAQHAAAIASAPITIQPPGQAPRIQTAPYPTYQTQMPAPQAQFQPVPQPQFQPAPQPQFQPAPQPQFQPAPQPQFQPAPQAQFQPAPQAQFQQTQAQSQQAQLQQQQAILQQQQAQLQQQQAVLQQQQTQLSQPVYPQPVVMQQPVVIQQPVVMQQPVVVQQPVYVQQQPRIVVQQPRVVVQSSPALIITGGRGGRGRGRGAVW